MSAVAVQHRPLGLLPAFKQKQHAAAPPASITASSSAKPIRTPGIISLSKPILTRTSNRARKSAPASTPTRAADVFQPTPAKPEPRSAKKPRSRPTSDEEEHDTPSKPRGRRPNNTEARASPLTPAASPAASAAKPRRNPSRARQTPSPTESDPTPASPALQKPSGRLARQRRGFNKSNPTLGAAAASSPVAVPQPSGPTSHPSGLSRSAPLATPAMSQTIPARMRRTLTASGPPQVGREDPMSKEVPPSPSPPRRMREASWKSQGPLTAPLNGGAGFPARPMHVRSPSEALFNLSLDEPEDESHDIPILFGRSTRGGDKVYAGGRFQNGPDPTMLPAPSFLAGF